MSVVIVEQAKRGVNHHAFAQEETIFWRRQSAHRPLAQFDAVLFACNANQTLIMPDRPTFLERWLLSSVRYQSELHNHTVVHSDASVLPDNEVEPLATRSNHFE